MPGTAECPVAAQFGSECIPMCLTPPLRRSHVPVDLKLPHLAAIRNHPQAAAPTPVSMTAPGTLRLHVISWCQVWIMHLLM